MMVDREGSSQGQCRWVEGVWVERVTKLEWVNGIGHRGRLGG